MAGAATNGKRAGVYVRVSSEEQVEGYSLAAQERAAEAFCAQHGWEPVVYREEGRSARTDDLAKRPAFRRLLADAEAGAVQVVVVHKLDRFARNRRVAFEAFERLAKAGVGFASIAENMDYSSPAGQLMPTMLVGLGPVLLRQPRLRDQEGQGRAQGAGPLQRRPALRRGQGGPTASPSPTRRPAPSRAARGRSPQPTDCAWPSSWRPPARRTARWRRR
jgi:DNA invertase Pin-like site-specific DNA recombinase